MRLADYVIQFLKSKQIDTVFTVNGDSDAPAVVGDATLWLDASISDSVIKDGSNNVSRWMDLSGNGNDGIANDVSKVTLSQNLSVFNNKDVITFKISHTIVCF